MYVIGNKNKTKFAGHENETYHKQEVNIDDPSVDIMSKECAEYLLERDNWYTEHKLNFIYRIIIKIFGE